MDTESIQSTTAPRLPVTAFFSPLKSQDRIVATIQPYSSTPQHAAAKSHHDHISYKQLSVSCMSGNLQESGVFEEDTLDMCENKCTQTEPTDFPAGEKASGDLCAEIQKLNRFRKKIEECVTNPAKQPAVMLTTSPNASDQRRMQYYKERLEILENKVLIYESSGDVQIRRLADRLQREVQLESWVKQLTERVEKLVQENLLLEEQKCEFEEAENDTRLHLQRLEVDLEILSQRNIELEMARDAAKANANNLQDTIFKAQDRIYTLEEHKNDLSHKMELLNRSISQASEDMDVVVDAPIKQQQPQPQQHQQHMLQHQDLFNFSLASEEEKYHELLLREQELKQNISELNRAYNETLENADNIWAQMEKEYKEKLDEAHELNNRLRMKILNIEERLRNEAFCAQERITQLEESEQSMQMRILKLTREHKEDQIKFLAISNELNAVADEHIKLKEYLEGPAIDQLEKERKKVRDLEAELRSAVNLNAELDEAHTNQISVMKKQLVKTNIELSHIGVSNGELKEEVATLEHRCLELSNKQRVDEVTIRNLTYELEQKQEQLRKSKKPKLQMATVELTLEQELRSAYGKHNSSLMILTDGRCDSDIMVQDLQKEYKNEIQICDLGRNSTDDEAQQRVEDGRCQE